MIFFMVYEIMGFNFSGLLLILVKWYGNILLKGMMSSYGVFVEVIVSILLFELIIVKFYVCWLFFDVLYGLRSDCFLYLCIRLDVIVVFFVFNELLWIKRLRIVGSVEMVVVLV